MMELLIILELAAIGALLFVISSKLTIIAEYLLGLDRDVDASEAWRRVRKDGPGDA